MQIHKLSLISLVTTLGMGSIAHASTQLATCVMDHRLGTFQIDLITPSINVESGSGALMNVCSVLPQMVESESRCAFSVNGRVVSADLTAKRSGARLASWRIDLNSMRMSMIRPNEPDEISDCVQGRVSFDDLDFQVFHGEGSPSGYMMGIDNRSPFDLLCHLKISGKFDDHGVLRPMNETTDITVGKKSENSQTWPRQNPALVEESSSSCEPA